MTILYVQVNIILIVKLLILLITKHAQPCMCIHMFISPGFIFRVNASIELVRFSPVVFCLTVAR